MKKEKQPDYLKESIALINRADGKPSLSERQYDDYNYEMPTEERYEPDVEEPDYYRQMKDDEIDFPDRDLTPYQKAEKLLNDLLESGKIDEATYQSELKTLKELDDAWANGYDRAEGFKIESEIDKRANSYRKMIKGVVGESAKKPAKQKANKDKYIDDGRGRMIKVKQDKSSKNNIQSTGIKTNGDVSFEIYDARDPDVANIKTVKVKNLQQLLGIIDEAGSVNIYVESKGRYVLSIDE
jgi:hypothetical protein